MRLRSQLSGFAIAAVIGSAALACGDAAPRERVGETAGDSDRYSPFRDSIRARAAARFSARPDTLLARADSARTLGAASAPLWVILVGQLQCANCADAVRDLLPVLRRDYVEPGRIRLAYINGPAPDTNFNARFAAHAVYCAALGGQFWPMLDSLAATRTEWARLPDPQPRFDSLAVRLGANASLQSACTNRALMMPLVMWDQDRAAAAGVKSLPTLLIGAKALSGDLSPARVRKAIDAALVKRG